MDKIYHEVATLSNLGVGFNDNHYFLYNISDPASPSTLSSQSFPQAQDALIKEGKLYISSATEGLYTYDISDPANPIQIARWDSPTTTIVYRNQILYLATLDQGVTFLDVRDPYSPVVLHQLNITEFDVKRLALRRNALMITSQDKVYFFDISNLQAPIRIGQYAHPYTIIQAGFVDSTLFIGDANENFNFIDAKSLYQLTFHTPEVEAGNYPCRVGFIDELGGSISQELTIRLEGPPQVNFPLPAQLAIVGQPFDYFIAQRTFTDPNFDSIEITARGQNGSLPEWVYFDGLSQVTGLPRMVDVGSETIIFELTDHHPQLPNTYTTLTLVVEEYLPSQHLVSGRYFEYVLPSFVFSQVGNVTQLSAQQMDGEWLPGWMAFDEHAAKFYGDPPGHYSGVFFAELKAINKLGDVFRRPFQLVFSINQPPYVQNQIPNQVANVGDEFRFPLSDTIFSDGNQDELTYFAKEEGKETLPTWLYFDGHLFSGQPERSDMNFFSGKRYNIEVIASDGYQNATLVFNADVKGTSNGELLFKVGSPILTVLGLGLTVYRNRKYILNRMNREKYQLPAVRIEVGKPCAIPLRTSADVGNSIQLKFKESQQSRCCGLFGNTHVSLFNGALPHWLHYDISSGQLRSDCVPEQPFPQGGQPIIQVKNKQGIIQEQFVIEVAYPENQSALEVAGDNANTGSSSLDMPSLPPPPLPPGSEVEMPSTYSPR